MLLKDVLPRIRVGNRIEIYSEQLKTTVFKGFSDSLLFHTVTQTTLSPYFNNEVWCLSAKENTIIIYCR